MGRAHTLADTIATPSSATAIRVHKNLNKKQFETRQAGSWQRSSQSSWQLYWQFAKPQAVWFKGRARGLPLPTEHH